MTGLRLYLTSRNAVAVVVVVAVTSIVAAVWWRAAVVIQFRTYGPLRGVPIAELASVACGCVIAAWTRPALGMREHLAQGRERWCQAAWAVALALLPLVPMTASLLAARSSLGPAWHKLPAIVVTAAALAVMASALMGPLLGPVTVFALWAATAVLQAADPSATSAVGLGGAGHDIGSHPVAAVLITAAAAATHYRTMGQARYLRA